MRGNKEPRKPKWKTIGKTNVLNCVQFLTRVPDRYHLIDLEEFLSNDHNEPQKILQINFFFFAFDGLWVCVKFQSVFCTFSILLHDFNLEFCVKRY